MGPKRVTAIACAAVLALLIAPAAARALSAVPCDHRYGARATWTHSSDGVRTSTAFLPELLAFEYDADFTVFESTDSSLRVPFDSRVAAYRTGRITPELYFHGHRGGSSLLSAESGWFKSSFGRWPAALAYSLGVDDDRAVVNHYVFAGRNSGWDGGSAYGASVETSGAVLGNRAAEFAPPYVSSMASSTRFYDMMAWPYLLDGTPNPLYGMPIEDVIDSTVEIERNAIASGGWYSDFTHWSSPAGPTLATWVDRQMAAIAETDTPVAKISYGEAVQHAFLRDSASATVTVDPQADVRLQVDWQFPYPAPPTRAITIPLSVRVDVSGTPLEGTDVEAPGSLGVRRSAEDEYIVEVPYVAGGSEVTLLPSDTASYAAQSAPSVEVARTGDRFTFATERPTQAVLFVAGEDPHLAEAADVVWRSSARATTHTVDLAYRQPAIGANVARFDDHNGRLGLFLGVIDEYGRSSLLAVDADSLSTHFRTPASVAAAYATRVTITGRLLTDGGVPLPGHTVVLQRKYGPAWRTISAAQPVGGEPGVYVGRDVPSANGKTYYRFHAYPSGRPYEACDSPATAVSPKARLTVTPPSARRHYATISISPVHRRAVLTLEIQKRVAGRWQRYVTRRTATSGRSARVPLYLPRGTYRIRATHADTGHAKSYSSWRTAIAR